MDFAQVFGFLVGTFLVCFLKEGFCSFCNCGGFSPADLQKKYCLSDVVLKGKIVGGKNGVPVWYYARYDFEPTEVLKKPNIVFEIKGLYTQYVGTTCAYIHGPFNDDEYVVTGELQGQQIIISECSFIKRWDQVSPEQQQGLKHVYGTRCHQYLKQ